MSVQLMRYPWVFESSGEKFVASVGDPAVVGPAPLSDILSEYGLPATWRNVDTGVVVSARVFVGDVANTYPVNVITDSPSAGISDITLAVGAAGVDTVLDLRQISQFSRQVNRRACRTFARSFIEGVFNLLDQP